MDAKTFIAKLSQHLVMLKEPSEVHGIASESLSIIEKLLHDPDMDQKVSAVIKQSDLEDYLW